MLMVMLSLGGPRGRQIARTPGAIPLPEPAGRAARGRQARCPVRDRNRRPVLALAGFTNPGQQAGVLCRYDDVQMTRSYRHRALHVPALIASLALFLMGSNYCVLTALSGDTRMACMSMPGDPAAGAVPACHRAAPTDRHSRTPAPKPSCCPRPLVAPAAPVIETPVGSIALDDDAIAAPAVTPASAATRAWRGHRPAPDGQPPPRLVCAPISARAPPLA